MDNAARVFAYAKDMLACTREVRALSDEYAEDTNLSVSLLSGADA